MSFGSPFVEVGVGQKKTNEQIQLPHKYLTMIMSSILSVSSPLLTEASTAGPTFQLPVRQCRVVAS